MATASTRYRELPERCLRSELAAARRGSHGGLLRQAPRWKAEPARGWGSRKSESQLDVEPHCTAESRARWGSAGRQERMLTAAWDLLGLLMGSMEEACEGFGESPG